MNDLQMTILHILVSIIYFFGVFGGLILLGVFLMAFVGVAVNNSLVAFYIFRDKESKC